MYKIFFEKKEGKLDFEDFKSFILVMVANIGGKIKILSYDYSKIKFKKNK